MSTLPVDETQDHGRTMKKGTAPPQEPLRRAYSREELQQASIQWLQQEYGLPSEIADDAEKDRWHTRSGMLFHFISDHFPQ